MSQTHNAKVTKGLVDWLSTDSDIFVWKQHQDMYSRRGIPDIVGVWRGYFFGIEVKQPNEPLRPSQEGIKRKIEQAGGAYLIAHSIEEGKEVFNQFKKDIDETPSYSW